MADPTTAITLIQSLAHDPRTNLERWQKDVEMQARNQCAQHDITGALSLVATDEVWNAVPGNITNPAQVLAGSHPPNYRARPDWDLPALHAANATAPVVSLYRIAAQKHTDFSRASSALTTVLLSSIGEANQTHLETTYPDLRLYMLTPRQIVDTMCLKHGVATSDDISRLREPLSKALTSLSDLTNHMQNFLLASQRLTRSGQGETNYRYFEMFLETVANFPSVAFSLTGYYVQYPAILQQGIGTLFPYLEQIRDHLIRGDPASPFSGTAAGPANIKRKKQHHKGKKQQPGHQTPQPPPQQTTQPPPQDYRQGTRRGPGGPEVVLSAQANSDPTPPDHSAYLNEIQRLNAALASMTMGHTQGSSYGTTPVFPTSYQPASMLSASTPRQFYCWLHGWNNTHHGDTCKVMGSNQEYTSTMKAARTPDGTGGNPKIGVPVTHLRPFFQPLHCVPCLTPTTLPPRPISPVSPPEASVENATPPCDDNFRASVVLPTLPALALSEGSILSCARELNRPITKPHPLPRPPPSLQPPLTVEKSRFASPNPFQVHTI